ncbi:hypothetical protein ACI796_07220 [Geodermatophilus sp. SYSU D00525]
MDRDVLRRAAVVAGVLGGMVSGATGGHGDSGESDGRVLPADRASGVWFPVHAGSLAYAAEGVRPGPRAADTWGVALTGAAGAVAAAVTRRVPGSRGHPAAGVWGLAATAARDASRGRGLPAPAATLAAGAVTAAAGRPRVGAGEPEEAVRPA